MLRDEINRLKSYFLSKAGGVLNGSLTYTGDLKSYKNSTPYTGYIFVPLTTYLTSTSWDGDARSTTAKTKIDLSAVFGVPANVKAVLARVIAWDSGSAANVGLWFGISPNSTANEIAVSAWVGGNVNDVRTDVTSICPCDSNGDIYYQCAASGSGTMDVYLQIHGYWI